jgi:hypothetical protein
MRNENNQHPYHLQTNKYAKKAHCILPKQRIKYVVAQQKRASQNIITATYV